MPVPTTSKPLKNTQRKSQGIGLLSSLFISPICRGRMRQARTRSVVSAMPPTTGTAELTTRSASGLPVKYKSRLKPNPTTSKPLATTQTASQEVGLSAASGFEGATAPHSDENRDKRQPEQSDGDTAGRTAVYQVFTAGNQRAVYQRAQENGEQK